MNENQKAFIRRHIQNLIKKELVAEQALEKSLVVLQDKQRSKEIINYFKKNGSLTKTLHHFSVIEVEPNLLNALEQLEKGSENPLSNVQVLTQTDETVASILSLFKLKLTMGLTYALWLSVIATIVFSIIQIKILPQFEDLFMGFGAELPSLTQLALDWQNSFISPALLGLLLVAAVAFLLFVLWLRPIKLLFQEQSLYAKLFRVFPFVSSVSVYLQAIRGLSGLQSLLASGQSLPESQNLLGNQLKKLEHYLPEIQNSLSAAAEIDELIPEIKFQQNQLELMAETLVSKASAKLTTSIMVLVVAYVVFTIFASYLPIFQLGAVV